MGKEEMCESHCCGDDFPKKLGMTAIAIVIVWLLIGVLGANMGWNKTVQTNYITSEPAKDLVYSNGNAKTTVQPDLAQFTVGMETEAQTAKEAQTENAKIMDEVQKRLQEFGISKEKIKTTIFYTQPVTKGEYKCPESKPKCESYEMEYESKIIGYKTVHLLQIQTGDLDKVGDMLDAASDANANRIEGVYFGLSDAKNEEIKAQLLVEAVKNAKQQAEKMAGAAGVKLGKPVSISEGYVYTPAYYAYDSFKGVEAAGDAIPSTSVSSGSLEVSASVSTSFEIQ